MTLSHMAFFCAKMKKWKSSDFGLGMAKPMGPVAKSPPKKKN